MLRYPYDWRRKEGEKSGIPKIRVLHYWMDCFFENIYIRLEKLPRTGINDREKREEIVTISMTSFPERINKVYYALKSLMLQSYKADKIILWLSEEQFPGKRVPKRINKLEKTGLTIRWCDDLRSHKKYFYALQEQKENEIVVTYDDDIIYEKDSLEKLILKHNEFPDCIICNRGHEIAFNEKREICKYAEWKVNSSEGVTEESLYVMPSTGNGCLYPYSCMPKVTFNWELIKKNALTADDIWMRFCGLQNKVYVVKTARNVAILCNVWGSQKERLTRINDAQGENQRVIKRLLEIFPNTFKE